MAPVATDTGANGGGELMPHNFHFHLKVPLPPARSTKLLSWSRT